MVWRVAYDNDGLEVDRFEALSDTGDEHVPHPRRQQAHRCRAANLCVYQLDSVGLLRSRTQTNCSRRMHEPKPAWRLKNPAMPIRRKTSMHTTSVREVGSVDARVFQGMTRKNQPMSSQYSTPHVRYCMVVSKSRVRPHAPAAPPWVVRRRSRRPGCGNRATKRARGT